MKLRSHRSLLLAGLALVSFGSSCSGCNRGPAEPPARWLAPQADLVIEIPDITVIAKKNSILKKQLAGIVRAEQYEAALGELKRALGFDPTSPEGLAAAGLPKQGMIGGEVLDGGRGGLWIIPAADAEKLTKTITDAIKSRSNIDETKEEALEGGGKLFNFLSTWGNEKYSVAAFTIQKGTAFLGAGNKSVDYVKQALARKKEESLLASPAYDGLVKAAAPDALVRIMVPSAKTILDRLGPSVPKTGLAAALDSTVWSVSLDDKTFAINARLRYKDADLKALLALFAVTAKTPRGVLATLEPDAVLTVLGGGDVNAILAAFAPPGSELGAEADSFFARLKDEIGLDVRGQVIPAMSGQGAFALGIGDISGLRDVRSFLMTPAKFLWSSSAIGLKSPEDAKKLSLMGSELDAAFERRGLVREGRKLKELPIETVRLKQPMEGQDPLLMESFVAGGAWIVTNTAKETERIAAAAETAASDPLKGAGGLAVTLRVAPLTTAIRAVNLDQIASGAEGLVIRSVVERALGIMATLSTVELLAEPVADGASVTLRVHFAPAPAAQN
ncbi:MAG: hypothetical protein U1E65_07020 [Myxococcota bacterium]